MYLGLRLLGEALHELLDGRLSFDTVEGIEPTRHVLGFAVVSQRLIDWLLHHLKP